MGMNILPGFTWLLLCQAAGELLVRATGWPLPGPVLGMLLLIALVNWAPARQAVGVAAEALLAHLSLLFVPVGVGVMVHMSLITQYGLRMMLALVLSTWIGLAITALMLRALLPSAKPSDVEHDHE